QTKREKYFAWKLLLGAIEQIFGTNAQFVRQPTGKWTCNLCHFSISHSNGVVAVAVSNNNVGVDVQRLTLPTNDKVVERIFSQKQADEYHNIVDKLQKSHYFTRVWTQKESIFKLLNQQQFLTTKPQNYNHFTVERLLTLQEKGYYLTVACEKTDSVKYVEITL
ncbi:MAG: 4'-phosphopantetheinyl transferase superfamily protein, partial [Clostridia bacterium]|nr:4'-phosphopantetheinyl transferase superfamily protein [Clostridia bacterium]